MNPCRTVVVFTLLTVACGQVTSENDGKGSGGKAGGAVDASHDGTAGVGADAGPGGSPGDGGSGGGIAGAAGNVGFGGIAGDAASSTCDVASPQPLVNPTPQVLEAIQLIEAYCASVVQQCPVLQTTLSPWLHASGLCSAAELVLGCDEDMLEQYLEGYSLCEAEWKTAVVCGTNATYDTVDKCMSANIGTMSSSPDMPCKAEKTALTACAQAHSGWSSVTGTNTTCQYGSSLEASCDIHVLSAPTCSASRATPSQGYRFCATAP